MRIKSLDLNGKLTLAFSEKIRKVKLFEMLIDPAALQIQILTDFYAYDPSEMIVSWKSVDMHSEELIIQL